MKTDDILDALNEVDDTCIKNAREPQKKNARKALFISLGTAAACLFITFFGIHFLQNYLVGMDKTKKSTEDTLQEAYPFGISFAGDYRERNTTQLQTSASAIVWPFEYRILCDQYSYLTYNGISYSCRVSYSGTPLSPSFVGSKLGDVTARGTDYIPSESETVYETPCEIYEIKGVDPSRFLAVKYGSQDSYYVFMQNDYNPPASLGDLMTDLNLPETFPFTSFHAKTDASDLSGLSSADSDALWSIFARYASAPTLSGTQTLDALSVGKRLLSFTVNAPALGVSNLAWTLTDGGYLKTNIENYGYCYYLGKEAVDEIVTYALTHKTEAPVKTTYSLVGEVTEVGDNYIKVDDTLCMEHPEDGMEFTIALHDLRVKRHVLMGLIKEGSHVVISHTGAVEGNPTLIETAYELYKGTIKNGTILIPD